MSVVVGQTLAFLKIGALALPIMAGIWLLTRYIEKRGRKKSKGGSGLS
ncbi:MAG: hypothetical protein ISR45_02120 [Rhodospirillales bacterium]|nr:hypothetical protein [Rhodospirillales bacterium]